MHSTSYLRNPFADITNEAAISRSSVKGKRRADEPERSNKRARNAANTADSGISGNNVEDTEMEELPSANQDSRYRSYPSVYSSLRALRMGGPSQRARFTLPTTRVLESFVSSNMSDLFKCHSLCADSFLTTPYACAYSNGSKAGRESLLAVATEEGTVSLQSTHKRQDLNSECTRTVFQIHDNGIFDVKWSNSDSMLATASGDRSVRITDPRSTTGKPIHDFSEGHRSTVKCLAWDPSHEDMLVSGGRDGNICLWDCRVSESQRPVLVIPHAHEPIPGKPEKKGRIVLRPKTVTSLAYLTDNAFQVISGGAGDGKLRKWDLRNIPTKTSKTTKNVPLLSSSVEDFTTLPSESPPTGGFQSPRRARGICSMAIGHGPSAGQIFTLCNDSRIHTYNAWGAAGAPLDILQKDNIYSHRHLATNSFYLRVSVSPCGRWLAAGGASGSAFLFDIATRGLGVQGIELKGQDGEISGVDWTDNALATCADDGTVRVWRPDIERYHRCQDEPELAKADWVWGRT